MFRNDTVWLYTRHLSGGAIGDSGPVGLSLSFFKYSDEILVMGSSELLDRYGYG